MDGTVRVLCVNSADEHIASVGQTLDQNTGRFDIVIVQNPREGLSQLRNHAFDCVLSGYSLPTQDGIEFLETVRAEYPDLPFILYTGRGSEQVASDALAAGVTDYVKEKPDTDQSAILTNRIMNAVSARRAEAEAEQTRHRLEQVVKTVPACIVRLNYEGEFVFANERATEVLGLEQSDVSGRTYNDPEWEIRDMDGNPIPDEELPFRQVRDTGEPLYGYRHAIKWPDGTERTLLVNGAPTRDDEGEVDGVVFALSDITANRERKTRLEETTARVNVLFEESPDMIDVHDADGAIREVNSRLCEETGYNEEELIGMDVWDIDQSVDREEIREMWLEMDVGERQEIETVYQRKDGSTFPAKVHVRRLDLDAPRFAVISRNITERKARETELRNEQQFIESLFNALPDPLYAVDTDGHPVRWNDRLTEVTGYAEENVAESHLTEFIPDEDTEAVLAEFERIIQEEQSATIESAIETKAGEQIPYEFTGAPLADADGTLRGVTGVGRDITERKQQEQDLKRQNERLEEFTNVVSHDLRNPINVADSRVTLLDNEVDSEHIEAIDRALSRMDSLIEDLLALARQNEEIGDLELVDLAEMAESCWDVVETSTATVEINTDKRVLADRSRLSQVFENLIRNAIEHSDGETTVTIGNIADGFYIEDTGPGIPEEYRDEVFTAGYSTATDGTGFGLNIVADVVDAHGWDIDIVEGSSGGARFEIRGVKSAEK